MASGAGAVELSGLFWSAGRPNNIQTPHVMMSFGCFCAPQCRTPGFLGVYNNMWVNVCVRHMYVYEVLVWLSLVWRFPGQLTFNVFIYNIHPRCHGLCITIIHSIGCVCVGGCVLYYC